MTRCANCGRQCGEQDGQCWVIGNASCERARAERMQGERDSWRRVLEATTEERDAVVALLRRHGVGDAFADVLKWLDDKSALLARIDEKETR